MSVFEVGDKVLHSGSAARALGLPDYVGVVTKVYYGNGVNVLYQVEWAEVGVHSGYTADDLDHFPTTPEGVAEWLRT